MKTLFPLKIKKLNECLKKLKLSKKIWALILILSLVFLIPQGNPSEVEADDVTTSVTVGNTAPAITAGPAENPASYATTPTNEGSDVTFEVTATDSNNEDYYIAVCTTDAVTAVNGDAPTCDVGTWCVGDTATSSGSQASCAYTTLGGDAQSNIWYVFVCDNNATAAACSSSGNTGSGDSGSPFKVNHDPSFSAIADDGGSGADSGADPGGTMTFTATASDSDDDTLQDTVLLVVCADTSGATSSGCIGTELCVSSLGASNPSCGYNVPAVTADGNNNYYAYVFDSHDFGSASNYRSGVYVVNNVAPVVSAVTLNGGSSPFTLTEGTTTNITVTATVTDNNACGDISTVTTSIYRSLITYGGCDIGGEDDDNDCYAVESCSVVGSGNTCDGASDASAGYECTVAIQYFADPTVASTQYPTEDWLNTVLATDDDAATDSEEVAAGIEMNTTIALDVTGSIAYGSLDVGQRNDPLDKVTTVTATGNVGLDEELKGTNMTGAGTITVGYQHYALAGSTAYASGTSLTTSDVPEELNCAKTTSVGSPATANNWWGIEIPTGTAPGVYGGTNTVTAVLGEIVDW